MYKIIINKIIINKIGINKNSNNKNSNESNNEAEGAHISDSTQSSDCRRSELILLHNGLYLFIEFIHFNN